MFRISFGCTKILTLFSELLAKSGSIPDEKERTTFHTENSKFFSDLQFHGVHRPRNFRVALGSHRSSLNVTFRIVSRRPLS